MKIKVQQTSPTEKKMEIRVGRDRIDDHMEQAYKEIGKTAKIKGFRPGKVPRHMLEKYYESEAQSAAMRSLVDDTYPQALVQEQVRPLSYPKIEITSYDPAKELVYEASVEVKPEIAEIKGYKGMKLKKDATAVSDQELEERVKLYQNYHTKLIPLKEDRPLKMGDVAIFDYEALREGEAFEGNKVEGYTAELGSGVLLKEFEEQMIGLKPSDHKEIDVNLPDNFSDKSFAGKKMHYSVTLKDIKTKETPALNDDFAKDLGHENLESFRNVVRDEIQRAKESASRGKLHREIITQLVKNNEIPVPQSMIEAELGSMYEQFSQNLSRQGQTPEGVGMTHDVFREQNQDEAKLRIQGMLIFERIWNDEQISVNAEDREKKIEELAQMMGQRKLDIRQYYEASQERLGQLDVLILQDKTLDFILSQAKIEENKT